MSTNPEKTHTSPETCARDAQVYRFDPSILLEGQMSLNRDGSYVLFEDYEQLRAENERLRAALEEIGAMTASIPLTMSADTMADIRAAARAALKQ